MVQSAWTIKGVPRDIRAKVKVKAREEGMFEGTFVTRALRVALSEAPTHSSLEEKVDRLLSGILAELEKISEQQQVFKGELSLLSRGLQAHLKSP